MSGGRIVLLTLIGGGSVVLTAFAVKYYLSRKAVLRESSASEATTATTTETAETTKQPVIVNSEDVATDVAEVAAVEVASVSASSPVAAVDDLVEAPTEDIVDAPEIVSVEANESAITPSAFSAESVIAEYSSPAPTRDGTIVSAGLRLNLPPVAAPFIAVDPSIIDEESASSATPPAVSIAFLNSEGSSASFAEGAPKDTPPTPPSTPMPPSRGDEGVDDYQAAAKMDLIQAAIQGRLEAVKPRYISTDSTGGDKDDEDVKDVAWENAEFVAAGEVLTEEESKDSAEAAADEKGESAAVSVSSVKLQPICEEGAASLDAAASSEVAPVFKAVKSEPAAEENKPKSPYMRRKRRSVQPEMEEMRIHQEMLRSNSPSPAHSLPKEAAEAAASELTPPPRTPRLHRRSERRSTGEINAAEASSPKASASPSSSSIGSSKGDEDVSVSSGSGSGIFVSSGSALDSINDYSFMSDADAAPAAESAAVAEPEYAAAAAPVAEVDLLEGIEDVSLDDLLRDISSMSESTAALMATSMLVEVNHPTEGERRAFGAGDDMAEVDEDLAKHLNMVDELVQHAEFLDSVVLDDKFFGAPSNEIDYTKSDSIINDPRARDDDGEFDVRVSIGFKEHDVMMTSTDSTSAMVASTDSDIMVASTDSAVMIASADSDTLPTADASAVLDNAVEGARESPAVDYATPSASKTTKGPKRVVRPRKERPPLEGAFGSTDSAEGGLPTAKKTSSSSTSKSPPAKTPRGSFKRTGIPKPGFQP